jgi:tetratricopeptide (TPR) repeat protein
MITNEFYVKIWEEEVIIPTYETGKPEKNPMFFERRVYQGSSGVVYPNPIIEKIYDEKKDKKYQAVFLENKYIKIQVLPQLGGRIQMAFDKIGNRHFIYYNKVIKPALVGLCGPWISGGIEFNWPQHHRPSTFDPIDVTIEEFEDGSKTVWVNEVEQMFRTKGMAGFTLYPDKAYVEVKVRLYNKTPFPQSFLWWANPAVKVNDFNQSVFPPDVHAVYDHGRRDVSDFPIATGTYYNVNYSPGTDISRYKNIPVPTSYMAGESKYDFIGSYEHDTQSGMLHVASHHVSTGKKQWTWGNGDFGKSWDRNLTDEDGPYVEIMCGVFTNNQPDFSWIQPNEEKSFEQYFMPYAEIGLVKNASKEAAINVDFSNHEILVKIYVTAEYKNAIITVLLEDSIIEEITTDLSPLKSYQKTITPGVSFFPKQINVIAKDNEGNVLISYQPEEDIDKEKPAPAKAALLPSEIETNELLFLNGLHLEQYRHATFSPLPYYEEALKRDAGDIRNNNALGLWYLRRGQFAKAEPYFRKTIERLTECNPNPYDGEPYYNLGLCLKLQNNFDEAYKYLYKATWNDAWQHNAFLQLSKIAAIKKDFRNALYLIEKSIDRNYRSHNARHLKAALLRKTGYTEEALRLISDSIKIDPFNYGCLFERYLVVPEDQKKETLEKLRELMRNSLNNYLEYAIDYLQSAMYEEAIALLTVYEERNPDASPLLYYYLGWLHLQLGNKEQAQLYFKKASEASPDYCFPNKLEDKMVLEAAISNHLSAKSLYYLGNYWYANRQYNEAIDCWERSISIDDQFATVHRNLSLACYNKLKDASKSISLLEKAFALNKTDARILMELDQLYKIENYDYRQRLELLEAHLTLVEERDDLYLERITIYNQLHEYEKARQLLSQRKFHPWEGGEGKVILQYLICNIELAKKALAKGSNEEALELLDKLEHYPVNLGEGKLYGTAENDIHYFKGCAYDAMGMNEQAVEEFISAIRGNSEPVQAIFYNDPQPDKIFYQGLAWQKLNNARKANEIFNKLISFGKAHLSDEIKIDYFAVSLPDLLVFDQDLNARNATHCNYMIGLGLLGLKKEELAREYFKKVLDQNINHQGALIHLRMIES